MSLRELTCLEAAILFCLVAPRAAAGDGSSADTPETPPEPPPMQVSIAHEAAPHMQPFARAYVDFGTNKFAFLVPRGFRLDGSDPGKIVLVADDYSCYLTFRIVTPGSAGSQELKSDVYRDRLLHEHPGATITDEFSRSAADHTGPAFDLQWKNSNGIDQAARLAYIPSPSGVLEFGLYSSPEKFSEGDPVFNIFLLSFCTNEGGKLKIIPPSDQI